MISIVVVALAGAASQGMPAVTEAVRCQTDVGQVVSLHQQQPAVAGTQLGVGFEVVPPAKPAKPASLWCNHMKCTRTGPDGQELCGAEFHWHCFTYDNHRWSKPCYIIRH